MKRNLFLVSAIVFAALTSCTKESELYPTVVSAESAQIPIVFSTYASSATETKGTAITSNYDFQTVHESFEVAAQVVAVDPDDFTYDYYDKTEGEAFTTDDIYENGIKSYELETFPTATALDYFSFSNVTYTNGKWTNMNNMYWPNSSNILYFGAYAPDDATFVSTPTVDCGSTTSGKTYDFSFGYTVHDNINKQIDLMYAMTSVDYLAPTDMYKSGSENSYVTVYVEDTNAEDAVNLHFKHALTQIAFTATKDADLDVYVKGLTICNVYNSGTFKATEVTDDKDSSTGSTDSSTVGDTGNEGDLVDADNFGAWTTSFDPDGWTFAEPVVKNYGTAYYAEEGSGGNTSMSHYQATLATLGTYAPSGDKSIKIKYDSYNADGNSTKLTSTSNVLMLMPQKLTPWVPDSAGEPNFVGYYNDDDTNTFITGTASSTLSNSYSYLAIDCEIYHYGMGDGAKIHDGYIFVPFDTTGINYQNASADNKLTASADAWLPGYKITYCLDFGGGYIVDEDNHDPTTFPEPGTVPDTESYMLRTITYTVSVDNWIDINDSIDLGEYNTSVIQ